MMSALRKKMESNSGLPPSILEMRAFWDQMAGTVQTWAAKTTNLEAFCEVKVRKVLPAHLVNDLFNEDLEFLFAAGPDTGPCVILWDQALVAQSAARRFDDDIETIAASSKVFLKLACEASAVNLCEKISTDVLWQDSAPALGTPDGFVPAENIFIGDGEYLHVRFEIVLGKKVTGIGMLFPIDSIRACAEKRWKALTGPRDGSGASSHRALRKSVRTSSITVNAVLDQLTMSVGQCSRLDVGQILPLENADPKFLRLSTETIKGPLDIAEGEMGIWKEARAVKLSSAVSDAFLRNVADL